VPCVPCVYEVASAASLFVVDVCGGVGLLSYSLLSYSLLLLFGGIPLHVPSHASCLWLRNDCDSILSNFNRRLLRLRD
jgi:hypothetical protein